MSRLYRVIVTTRIVVAFDIIASTADDAKSSALVMNGSKAARDAVVSRRAYVQRVRRPVTLKRYNYVDCE